MPQKIDSIDMHICVFTRSDLKVCFFYLFLPISGVDSSFAMDVEWSTIAAASILHAAVRFDAEANFDQYLNG